MNFKDPIWREAVTKTTMDCLLAMEVLERDHQRGLSRAHIRHAISMMAPLGTRSESIDKLCNDVCLTLLTTGLVVEVAGEFRLRSWVTSQQSNQMVTDNLELN